MNGKPIWIVAILFISMPFSSQSFSKYKDFNKSDEAAIQIIRDDVRLARQVDFDLAPLRSRADLNGYMSRIPKDSPINALPVSAAKRFFESVEFNEKGVTTFSYQQLSGVDSLTKCKGIVVEKDLGWSEIAQSFSGSV
ncbi:hypothetical protein XcuCFBP2542_15720, partial [Xanthomonas cucurbitae]